jgi:hypothetical protein
LTAGATTMNALSIALRRELRVACSRHAQPVWFRLVKWSCLLTGVALFHDRYWFWWSIAGLTVVATALHLFYRWKTQVWTRAWGGWNDLDAGRDF